MNFECSKCSLYYTPENTVNQIHVLYLRFVWALLVSSARGGEAMLEQAKESLGHSGDKQAGMPGMTQNAGHHADTWLQSSNRRKLITSIRWKLIVLDSSIYLLQLGVKVCM